MKPTEPATRSAQTVALVFGLSIMLYGLWSIWPHNIQNQYDGIVKFTFVFFGLLLFMIGAMMKVEDEENENRD